MAEAPNSNPRLTPAWAGSGAIAPQRQPVPTTDPRVGGERAVRARQRSEGGD